MRKLTALLLTLVLLAGCAVSLAADYETLRVGATTAFSGNFFSAAIGSNVCDQDVRKLIHSYSLVTWVPADGAFRPNGQVVTSDIGISEDGATLTFAISKNLRYNDGTPITAKDYAFSFLLTTSRALLECAGTRASGSHVSGWQAYDEGLADTVTGFRLLGDYSVSITLDAQFLPYFYEMEVLNILPYPISVIAPGCEVKDDGNGICISGGMTADTLRKTLLDPETGYASHPAVTSGAYQLVSYDGETVTVERNPEYIGDADGVTPQIPRIEFRAVAADELIRGLYEESLDLVVRCARNDQIHGGLALAGGEGIRQYAYSRNGLAFISFCAEKGATADVRVRQALALCMDKTALAEKYLGGYGMKVDGYYGIGQWMYQASLGTIEVLDRDGSAAQPEEISLAGIRAWELDPVAAGELLAAAGWNLNEEGGAYEPAAGGIRFRMNGDRLEPLKLKLIYPVNNDAGPLLADTLIAHFAAAGGELETEAVPMPALLEQYYHITDRACDMIMLGSNFSEVFDPSVNLDGSTDRLSGVNDAMLADLARRMRSTAPGDTAEYCRRWAEFILYRSEVLPEIPLYSNTYMDFAISELQDYRPGEYSSWAEAIQYARLSDYQPGAEDDGDDWIFD